MSCHVVPVARSSVGLDGPLPVDHIGAMTLESGIQAIYIRHSDRHLHELWQHASNIGQSQPLHKLKYFDHEFEGSLCDEVRSALGTTSSEFGDDFFMCSKVGNLVAVGIGGNVTKRSRAIRIAAAVCFQLQETSPVWEFIGYPELESLIELVCSCCRVQVD